MQRLLLVRHAASVPPTPDGPDEYQRPLTDFGRRQADELADHLVRHSPTRVLSSPYLRAVQTVAPTAAALGLVVETRQDLAEWRSGIGACPSWRTHYRACWERPDWCVAGGETHRALEDRVAGALSQVVREGPPGAVTVIGSHGTWIARALRSLGCPTDADFWLDMVMPAVFEVQCHGTATSVSGPGLH